VIWPAASYREVKSLLDKITPVDSKISPKDFRTRIGTAVAATAVKSMDAPKTEKEKKKAMKAVAEKVAAALGNTPGVALQYYILPTIFDQWVINGE
jgi:DNA topoisomerase IB